MQCLGYFPAVVAWLFPLDHAPSPLDHAPPPMDHAPSPPWTPPHPWTTFRDAQRSAVTLSGTIFVDDRVNSCSTCLLICCIKPISHLQTPSIIIKSCHSSYHDLWAHRKWARERVITTQKHVQMWYIPSEPAGMSIIIINICNPAPRPKFKLCSVFCANNPTVIDASGVMLSVRSCRRGGMMFGVPAEQQQSPTCFFSPHFFQLM